MVAHCRSRCFSQEIFSTRWSAAGRLQCLTRPDGRVTDCEYDAAGMLTGENIDGFPERMTDERGEVVWGVLHLGRNGARKQHGLPGGAAEPAVPGGSTWIGRRACITICSGITIRLRALYPS